MSPTGTVSKDTRRTSIRAPKVGHKKSRNGCQTCKARRVKCDEKTPECGICLRLGLDCTYVIPEPSKSRPKSGSREPASGPPLIVSPAHSISQGSPPSTYGDSAAQQAATGQTPDPLTEESEQRRYLELRLLHHWMLAVSRPFGMTSPPAWKELWYGEVPQVALTNRNVLYAMFTMTATHLLGTCPNDVPLYQARENYWVWALREQRAAIVDLDNSNTDAVAYAALLISMNSLAMLQERSIEPYTPPIEWLEVGRGAFTVLPSPEAVPEGTGLRVLMDTTANIWQANATFDAEMQREFGAILNRDIPSQDVWDQETCESYETTLSYIGSFRRGVLAGEAADINLRWICMFPFMVPRKFVDFLVEGRPRALVTLAYFFAVVGLTDALQYLGNTGDRTTAKREIYAIRSVLSQEWQSLMQWPLNEIGGG
ncbi:hypothetical protein CKM354_000852600 [Cercospora kikuchii]|uniref:Zn(2)-C6 fungal-type domain-containing protein n=2 Tax=Cercospora kikuchii TaxID=84275 RepID=A0A9P3CM99_9PEZI|nr:uncharacterized protein CKM354_000852600 [Cercospora kikuchii]GIZ45353.1 hypothetical protein CKM354_000852600 [Cercospora kikuchii]